MAGLMPLFPLQIVALPGMIVPLHIFEERYKTMVGNCEKSGDEFGIVLTREGGIVNVGCTVVVETVLDRYPDGRFDILTRGQRRFEIVSLDEELEWLRGEVRFFEDDDPAETNPQLRRRAIACWQEISEALAANQGSGRDNDPDTDDPQLSFDLAQRLNDLDFQNRILRSRSEAERLREFIEFARGYVERLDYTAKMKRVIPTNGSGHKPANL